ncbi:hypothetical protein CHU98_g238 [Xylaria longipes]|nr:hypothetical protein CHU98_g238 [Xylaria longipes]
MDLNFHQRLEAAMASGDTAWFEEMVFPKVHVNPDAIIDEDTIKKISRGIASTLAKRRSQSVLRHFTALNDVLGRYEDTIRSQSQPRDVYMWPSINLEDLSTGNTLLRFLNSRGRHFPATFATMDGQSTRLGGRSGALPMEEVPGPEMDLDRATPEGYGIIKPIQYQSVDDMLQNNRFGAATGLRILEIQERILQFLKSMCAIILHDKNLDNPLDPILLELEALPAPTGDWLSAARAAQTASYEVPQNINLNCIKSISASRVDEAQDHLWSLREDPAYFADCIGNWSEHSFEMVPDDKRKQHPDVSDALRMSRFWDRVINNAVYNAYDDIFHWRIFDQQLDQIIKLQTASNAQPPRSIEKAGECYEAIRKLKLMIETRYIITSRHWCKGSTSYFHLRHLSGPYSKDCPTLEVI